MSGHSHWATIKRKKGAIDAKKGRMFSKCAKLIMSAARAGGGDPTTNLHLRYAIDDARAVNMTKDSIERAILKGTGQLEGVRLEDVVYEGYGPGGVALYIEAITDNRNRTAPEIRKLFEGGGGSLGGPGSVAWMFEKKGILSVNAEGVDEDELMEIVLEAGAEDMQRLDDLYEITTDPSSFTAVKTALVENDIPTESAELTNVATQNVTPSPEDARKVMRLMENLEDHDDVQNVSANIEITPELVEAMDEDE